MSAKPLAALGALAVLTGSGFAWLMLAGDDPYGPQSAFAGAAVISPRARSSSLQTTADWEAVALSISAEIQQRHLPFGTILDPVFLSPESDEIEGYSRAGDSAIWTGHYLAAEAYRYRVTGSPQALDNARRAVAGIRYLVDVTGNNLLARALVLSDSLYAAGILREEAHNGVYPATLAGRNVHWVGNTSRDQYLGAFLGLSLGYEMIDDAELRAAIRNLVTRMLDYLTDHGWLVVMPSGAISTVFHHRPDQQLALLMVGRQVDPGRFDALYRRYRWLGASLTATAIATDALDEHSHYFKFNLDSSSLFHLLRLEDSRSYHDIYSGAYDVLRRATAGHPNAYFHLIDRALKGPDPARDAVTIELLAAWLKRPRRDPYVDLRGQFEACGHDRACDPIPVALQVRSDFLWQRSPFLLYGGAEGRIEGPGIDFILPYWMARFYQLL